MDTLTLVVWLGAVALVALAIAVMTVQRRRAAARAEAKRLLDAADAAEREERERTLREHRDAMARERPTPLAAPAPRWSPPAPPRRTSAPRAGGRSARMRPGYQPGSSGYVPGVSDGGGWSGGYDGGSSSGSSDSGGGGSCGGGGGGGE